MGRKFVRCKKCLAKTKTYKIGCISSLQQNLSKFEKKVIHI